ncbi:hypothetical protein MTR67_007478 [Solanum verrucosum]|uniref:Uncharacterized protein n=1 Tax=Solanum verrucosum TaxID=315347 RepID=A0AAF0TF41_SOLVR|nr:hypothetical protein MTR67_007478 [Solanum verrucosum]
MKLSEMARGKYIPSKHESVYKFEAGTHSLILLLAKATSFAPALLCCSYQLFYLNLYYYGVEN